MKTLITVLAITTTLALASASIDSPLKYGMRTNEVSELQDFLVDKGFLTTTPSGFFGLLTLKAVKAYQLSVGLSNSGFVGNLTRSKINEELAQEITSSKEVEVKETGTTTQIVVIPQVIYVQAPVQQVIPQIVEVAREDYTLQITKVIEHEDYNSYCHCMMGIGFSITPIAELNGKPIEVKSCSLIGRLGTAYPREEKSFMFDTSSGDYPKRINSGEKGILSCTLVNGKILTN